MLASAPPLVPSRPDKSTIVRSIERRDAGSPPLPRLLLRATTAVSPPLAAALAERLFLTPRRHPAPAWERDALARGTPFPIDAAGERLRAWRFGAGPAVVLVHGWSGRAGQLAPFFEPLEEAGFSVIAFDAPAHGASPGRLAAAPTFAAAIADVARQVDARAVIAHSLGAAGLGLALAGGLSPRCAVLVAAPRSPAPFLRAFADALALRPDVERALEERLAGRFGIRLEDLDLARRAGAATAPVLVVHDRDDREVPWSDGAAVAGAFPRAELVTTSGLGHRRVLRDPAVVRQVVRFVAAHAGWASRDLPASALAPGA